MRRKIFYLAIALLAVGYSASPKKLDIEKFSGMKNAVLLETDVIGGGLLNEEALSEAATQGVATVIDLRHPSEGIAEEGALVRKHGMTYVNIPVTPETLSREQVDRVAELFADSNKRPALIHCSSGNRVGGLWALYLRFHRDMTPEDAYAIGVEKGLRNEKLQGRIKDLLYK
jgi:uncharacterized protein (TIGR01244 family)